MTAMEPVPTLSISKLGMKLSESKDGQIIATLIDYVKELHILDMRGNTLGVNAAIVIANSLETVSTLKSAIFSDMFTGRLRDEIPICLKALFDAIIEGRNSLEFLDLSHNALGPSALPGFEAFLASPPCFTLKTLRFINCGLGGAGVTVANRLIECHMAAERAGITFDLHEFSAGRNRLEDNGARALSTAFSKLRCLRHIELPQNGIKKDGIRALANGISVCSELETLNLNDNTFTADGAYAMADAIRQLEQCLVVVDFGDCLCRAATVAIMEALVDNHNQSIKELNLTGNELTPNEAEAIIDLAQQLPALQKLHLGTNNYGSEFGAVQAFIEKVGATNYISIGTETDDDGSLDSDDDNDESDAE